MTRPFQAIPDPDPFIRAVIVAFTEELVLSGYDATGTTYDPDDEAAVREDLQTRNQRVPGTVGIHVSFDEAPIIVGFGTAYTEIRCTIYDSDLEILLTGELDPPERRSLRELLLPPRWPEVEGRSWGRRAWRNVLSHFFPARG